MSAVHCSQTVYCDCILSLKKFFFSLASSLFSLSFSVSQSSIFHISSVLSIFLSSQVFYSESQMQSKYTISLASLWLGSSFAVYLTQLVPNSDLLCSLPCATSAAAAVTEQVRQAYSREHEQFAQAVARTQVAGITSRDKGDKADPWGGAA